MDSAARWQRVCRLFLDSLDHTEQTRERWLREQCADDAGVLAEVSRLLEQHARPVPILDDDAQALLDRWEPATPAADTRLGSDIGHYRLERLLGRGGMGSVYLALRIDDQFAHKVALKLVRSEFATPELHQRFLRERNTLARLAHPNIAALYDGGVGGDGAPYFTLEYVEGEPITRWCDAHRCGIRARIELLLKVCDAVQHAHRSLIVHRDLKPSNILVNAQGEPKLLDFGISKPLAGSAADEPLTDAHLLPMTRDYAAPEQLLGDPITTATDIYALGILLYLLLTGNMPYASAERGDSGWTRAILEETPETLTAAVVRGSPEASARAAAARATTPEALRRSLRGDLERIVQRALAKSPNARYASVDALVLDLRAYLEGRPLSGGTRTYRLRKFVSRHRFALAAGAALLLVAIAGAEATGWQAHRAAQEAQATLAVKEFLISLFRGADPKQAKGRDVTARELIDRGAEHLDERMQGQQRLRGELESVLGEIYNDLGLFEKGERLGANAVADLSGGDANPTALAAAETEHARALLERGDFKAALALVGTAAARLRSQSPRPAEQLARTLALDSYTKLAFHKFDEAMASANEALALARSEGVSKETLADVLSLAAKAARGTRDTDLSEQLQREVIALHRALRGSEDASVATDLDELAQIVDAAGRLADARDLRREAWTLASRQLGDNDPRLAWIRMNYADTLRLFGDFQNARRVFDQAETFYRNSSEGAYAFEMLRAGLAHAEGDYASAAAHDQAAIQSLRTLMGPDSPTERSLRWELALLHAESGNLQLAGEEIAALEASPSSKVLSGVKLAIVRGDIARLRGDRVQSEKILRAGLAALPQGKGSRNFEAAHLTLSLARTLLAAGNTTEAAQRFREVLAMVDDFCRGEMIPLSADAAYQLALLRADENAGRSEALKLAERVAPAFAAFYGAGNARARDARALLDRLRAHVAPAGREAQAVGHDRVSSAAGNRSAGISMAIEF